MGSGIPFKLPTLKAGTVVGRLSGTDGPAEEIPFETLSTQLGTPGNLLIATSIAGTNAVTGTTTGAPVLATNEVIYFIPASNNTAATTFNRDSKGAKNVFYNGGACIGGELLAGVPALIFYDGTQYNLLAVPSTYNTVTSVPRSYLAGCTLSTAGGSGTMSIAAGICLDSTNVTTMTLAAIAKTTVAWAVGTGNGGIDTGVIANSTWYHFYVIERVDTKVVDVLFSLSASAPTMPANYTVKRRIGSGKTDGSAHWTAFVQNGDEFLWSATVTDVNVANLGTSATSYTLTVPTGIQVWAKFHASFTKVGAVGQTILITALDESDQAPTAVALASLSQVVDSQYAIADFTIRTNTSAQIRARSSVASSNFNIGTNGWIDRRGRDA